jgi:hypothetical protein
MTGSASQQEKVLKSGRSKIPAQEELGNRTILIGL